MLSWVIWTTIHKSRLLLTETFEPALLGYVFLHLLKCFTIFPLSKRTWLMDEWHVMIFDFFHHRKQVYCLWLTLLIGGNWLNLLLNDFHELNIHSLFRSIENPLLLFDEQLPSIFLSLLRQHIGSSNVILTIKYTRQAKKEIFSIAIPKSNCINTRLLLAFTLLFKKK